MYQFEQIRAKIDAYIRKGVDAALRQAIDQQMETYVVERIESHIDSRLEEIVDSRFDDVLTHVLRKLESTFDLPDADESSDEPSYLEDLDEDWEWDPDEDAIVLNEAGDSYVPITSQDVLVLEELRSYCEKHESTRLPNLQEVAGELEISTAEVKSSIERLEGSGRIKVGEREGRLRPEIAFL